MKLLVLFGQRKQSYDGQYAPEALECIDEHANDENPDFLREHLDDYERSREFSALKVIALTYDGNALATLLNATPELPVTHIAPTE